MRRLALRFTRSITMADVSHHVDILTLTPSAKELRFFKRYLTDTPSRLFQKPKNISPDELLQCSLSLKTEGFYTPSTLREVTGPLETATRESLAYVERNLMALDERWQDGRLLSDEKKLYFLQRREHLLQQQRICKNLLETRECSLCYEDTHEKDDSIVLFPCGHGPFCFACGWTLMQHPPHVCPLCRGPYIEEDVVRYRGQPDYVLGTPLNETLRLTHGTKLAATVTLLSKLEGATLVVSTSELFQVRLAACMETTPLLFLSHRGRRRALKDYRTGRVPFLSVSPHEKEQLKAAHIIIVQALPMNVLSHVLTWCYLDGSTRVYGLYLAGVEM